jgi:hypothetical protein
MEKMSCVILVIYILADSHLWKNRCIDFQERGIAENATTLNRKNTPSIYAIGVKLTLKNTYYRRII